MRKFVERTSFLRTMSDKRANDFFYPGNAVHGEPDYGLAENFVRTAEAFANTTQYEFLYTFERKCLYHPQMHTKECRLSRSGILNLKRIS